MSPQRKPIATVGAPTAVGPYSQAISFNDIVYCSGMVPIDEAGQLVGEDPITQLDHCLGSLSAIAEEAGTHLSNALRVTIYTTSLERFSEMNAAYERWFDETPPARVTVGVAALPKGAAVEVEAIIGPHPR